MKFISNLNTKFRLYLDTLLGLNNHEVPDYLDESSVRKIKRSFSINLPFHKGRTVRGLGFTNQIKDPYSEIASSLLKGQGVEEITEKLFSIYQEFKNYSVYDFIEDLGEEKFKFTPLWAIVNPWDNLSLEQNKKAYLDSFYKNRSENNLNFENSKKIHIESILYSKESAKSQVVQFQTLIKKIRTNGYIENPIDMPIAIILIKNSSWCWIMGDSGNHRAHIRKELGYTNIRCKISKVIEYKDLVNTKNVNNSNFSLSQAKLLFDRIFEGKEQIRGPI